MQKVTVAGGWGGSSKGELTADAMARNRIIAERLGCLDGEEMTNLRSGKAAAEGGRLFTTSLIILKADQFVAKLVTLCDGFRDRSVIISGLIEAVVKKIVLNEINQPITDPSRLRTVVEGLYDGAVQNLAIFGIPISEKDCKKKQTLQDSVYEIHQCSPSVCFTFRCDSRLPSHLRRSDRFWRCQFGSDLCFEWKWNNYDGR
jgi:hypothetical protein